MGASSTLGAVERPSADPGRRQGHCPAQQPSGLPGEQLPGGRGLGSGGHKQRLCHIRSQAGANRSPDTKQDLLLLLAHDQGPGVEHAHARRHPRQEHPASGLRETHGRPGSANGRFREVRRGCRYGQHTPRSGTQATSAGTPYAFYGE